MRPDELESGIITTLGPHLDGFARAQSDERSKSRGCIFDEMESPLPRKLRDYQRGLCPGEALANAGSTTTTKREVGVTRILDGIDEALWQQYIHSPEGQAWAQKLGEKALTDYKTDRTVEFTEIGE